MIIDLLTAERLRSYCAATSGDITEVMRPCEWNTEAAAAVISLISMTEVIVRNALDSSLISWSQRRHPSISWLDAADLDTRGRSDIARARERASRRRPHGVHGKVIAELPFGFWRFLTASRYLTTLWIPALATAFPHGHKELGQRRKLVEQRMERLAFVRNRAAHHEPIHQRNLARDVDDAVTLMGWVSPDAAGWMRTHEHVTAEYLDKPQAGL
ncbi:MAG TPA: hypothetical protein VFR17_12550 [Mycobacterium sp.]|nr:hypothetical protein [Mycobacterium sp.]